MSDTKIYHDHLKGITCDALHCAHQEAGMCCANHITVQSENAVRRAETFCSTFAPK